MAEKATKQYVTGTGRRKRAIAQVRITPGGSGKYIVNEESLTLDDARMSPLALAGVASTVDVSVKVEGGGFAGQADAIRHGLARALVAMDEVNRTTMRGAGLLTRDPRERERKKPGLRSARRSPQWSKR